MVAEAYGLRGYDSVHWLLPSLYLSKKEFEVFLLLVGGQTVNEISESMGLSRSTVANHHTHIMKKLGVSNHVDLTKLAISHGIIEA